MGPSDRPTFTQEQIQEYLDYIHLPDNARELCKSSDPSDQLKGLSVLLRHQLCHIPFENLDLHYAPTKGVSLNIYHLFNKVIQRKAGRGGYCMQNNSLFATLLRSLGYIIVTAGARVAADLGQTYTSEKDPDDVAYGGYTHQVNFVTIGGQKYFIDVGFGTQGPTVPIPLIDGVTALQTGVPDRVAGTSQLTRGFTGNHTSRTPEQMVWRYNVKHGAASDTTKNWFPIYCFNETEFMPHDFEISSAFVSTSRTTIFVNSVFFVKYIAGEGDDEGHLIGELTMADKVIKERRFGDSKVLKECDTEEERVQGLREILGLTLSLGESEGIKGYHTEIK